MKLKEGELKLWTHKIKAWTINSYLPSENCVAYIILPTSTTIIEDPIVASWYGTTWLLVSMPSTLLQNTFQTASRLLSTLLNPLHQPISSQMIPY